MPQLPTITVTQTQADRMLAAYGSQANYLEWLRQSVVTYVMDKERQNLQATADATQQTQLKTLQDSLPQPPGGAIPPAGP